MKLRVCVSRQRSLLAEMFRQRNRFTPQPILPRGGETISQSPKTIHATYECGTACGSPARRGSTGRAAGRGVISLYFFFERRYRDRHYMVRCSGAIVFFMTVTPGPIHMDLDCPSPHLGRISTP